MPSNSVTAALFVAPLALTSVVAATAQVELVGRGTISTAAPEFAITFTPDGAEAYFTRTSAGRDTMVIMVSRRTDDGRSAARVAPFSGRYVDVDPFITPDGRRLYFSSTRPRRGEQGTSFNTWYVERQGVEWSEPIDPGSPLNSDSTDIFVSLSTAGELALRSNRSGATRVYLARPTDGGWAEPTPVTFGTTPEGSNPLLHPSGRAMVIVRAGPDDRADLFVSCRERNGDWGTPSRLPLVNSQWAEFAPAFDPGARSLYFTSERPGVSPAPADGGRPPGDIYRIPIDDLGVACLSAR